MYCTNIEQIINLTRMSLSFQMRVYLCGTVQTEWKEAKIHASFCMLMSLKVRICASIFHLFLS